MGVNASNFFAMDEDAFFNAYLNSNHKKFIEGLADINSCSLYLEVPLGGEMFVDATNMREGLTDALTLHYYGWDMEHAVSFANRLHNAHTP